MSEYLFGWLPVRDVITISLFTISLALLIGLARGAQGGKYRVWIVALLLWDIGMIFDALRRVEGWAFMRIVEHLFQLFGSVVLVYAAFDANRRLSAQRGF